jgi:acetolactate synthase-1/3 small subunit
MPSKSFIDRPFPALIPSAPDETVEQACSTGTRRLVTRPAALFTSLAGRPPFPNGTRVFDFCGHGLIRPAKRQAGFGVNQTKLIMRHTISVLVENKFGALTRIAGLFSGRGYNIDTLNVGPTHEPSVSRMTIVTRGDDATVNQIVKQLEKLVDVIEVLDFREGEYVDRELVLVKVGVNSETRAEVMQITDIFRAKIVDVQPASVTIEITGNESKVEKFLDLMKTFGIAQLTRTGKVAMPRK